MKKIVLITIYTLICGAMFAVSADKETKPDGKKTDWERDGLNGKVKSLKTVSYTATIDSGQLRKGEIIEDKWGFNNTLIKINEKGNWTEYSSYKPDGENIRLEIVKYDSEGNPFERRDYNYGNIARRWEFTADKNGNIIKALSFDTNDNLTAKSFYRFDENNYQIEANYYNANDSLISKSISNYDENGNLIESINYGSDRSITTKTLYKYDSLRNNAERTIYGFDENLIEKTIYEYNEKKLVTETNTFKTIDNSNSKTTYEYKKYDAKDNWVKRVEYKDSVVVKITERQIEYYD